MSEAATPKTTASADSESQPVRELVLVGGGHSHVQVLRSFAMLPPWRARTTLVVDTPIATYSGMVPGLISQQYRAEELEIDVLPLARRAGVNVIQSACVGIDTDAKRILLADRASIPYDVASFDVGSTVIGLELPGVREHAVATRPINQLVREIDGRIEALKQRLGDRKMVRVVVVGGGAGGVEVAFALDRRLLDEGLLPRVSIVHNAERLLPGYSSSLVRRVEAAAAERHIVIRSGEEVASATGTHVRLASGEELDCDLLLWVTGAAAHDLFAPAGLPVDEKGFVYVRDTLQIEGHDDLFAVGDCATLRSWPERPKAGVYAVRMGPVIDNNLHRHLEHLSLSTYKPQRDFLTLLNLSDGRAIGGKWSFSAGGRWVFRLKDRIDRKFMRKFQVLDESDGLSEEFSRLPAMMEDEDMLCGGCAAKLGPTELSRAIARLDRADSGDDVVLGLEQADDAAAWRTRGGEVVVASVDAFRGFSDDGYLVGHVAAINAISDLYAKGTRARFAQALVTIPDALEARDREELLYQVLSGAQRALREDDVELLGGHTTTGPELMVGFHVEGTVEDTVAGDGSVWAASNAQPGDQLVLTKPLGTGVLLYADAKGLARGRWIHSAHESMTTSNLAALEAGRSVGVRAATDVTGFGFARHLFELLSASGTDAVIHTAGVPALPGALELLRAGHRSTSHEQNLVGLDDARRVDSDAAANAHRELLYDPQTAGGLLVACPTDGLDTLLDTLPRARRVGELTRGGETSRIRLV